MAHDLHSITFLRPSDACDIGVHVACHRTWPDLRVAVCGCGWAYAAAFGPLLVREAAAHVRSECIAA